MRASRANATVAAYVLHHYDWSESSLILDLFTRESGRLAVAAKGAKRPYSQWRSVLLPFQRIQAGFGRVGADTDSEIVNLRSAEWAGGTAMLTGEALFSGFYLNELLMKLLARSDPHPALFDAYAATLRCLGPAQDLATEAALRAFELVLLKQTGVLPDLARVTATQQGVKGGRHYTLNAVAGVADARDPADARLPGEVLEALQAALDTNQLAAVQAACASELPALKLLIRGVLHYHLGSSPLRTRQVMVDLQKLERTSPA